MPFYFLSSFLSKIQGTLIINGGTQQTMKVDVKKIDATTREIKFEVPKERIAQKLEEVYLEFGKEAKVPGFRQGKVPRNVLEQRYGRLAQDETIKQVIPDVYREALEQEKLEPMDMPEINDVQFKDGKLSFTAKLEIRPEVSVNNYKGAKINRKAAQVSEEELNKTLEIFKQGHKKDKEVIIDDAFARELGFPGLEEFKNSLRRQLEMEKERQNRLDIEHQIVDHVLKNAQLAVPASAIKKQVERRLHDIRHRMEQQGLKKEDIDKRLEDAGQELREGAERDLKVYFSFEKIAELEKIEIEEKDNLVAKVMGFLLKEAQWVAQDTTPATKKA